MDTLFENGISTTLRPASDMSQVRRGPFVEMASLAICTRIDCPLAMNPDIFPFLPIALSRRMVSKFGIFLLLVSMLTSFCWVVN